MPGCATLTQLGRYFVCELAHILLPPPLAGVLEGCAGRQDLEERLDRALVPWREVDEEGGCDEEAVAWGQLNLYCVTAAEF